MTSEAKKTRADLEWRVPHYMGFIRKYRTPWGLFAVPTPKAPWFVAIINDLSLVRSRPYSQKNAVKLHNTAKGE